MSSLMRFKCARCTNDFYERWHHNFHVKRAVPDIDICQACRVRDQDARVAAVKAELAMVARSPIALLLAEVSALRDSLISSGKIDELKHYRAVLAAAKKITGVDDGKADQAEDPTGLDSTDTASEPG